ncbi:hypothetical protein PsYK624_063020 [Phanerochaete sordida]|uniref:DUF6535 domain-containing protein n=1 Tax=Phanerochaete sordida TaxID=48140 RepID=A0A9P3LC61_9APHY|nr:hypothetical protein PsYK624_063020 [Phanerochaete sordida]
MERGEKKANGLQASQDGWTSVEQRMDTKDNIVMKGYSEDIDSLLVLDGLFSAVVTGFVVGSVSMLQEDSAQTSAQLLAGISIQLSSLRLTPPYLNSTMPAPTIPRFQPSSSARWINSLWFISLILSLASALLGILTKQWIREYLQWNNPIASARENVLLREIRAEAWYEWHATAVISSVPVLLEIAVILFTCGLAVFVWTLDLVVAVVVTICVALFLLLIIILTLLPAFCKHCPYKSPTAWAVTRLIRWLSRSHELVTGALARVSRLPKADTFDLLSVLTTEYPVVSHYNSHFEKIHSITYLRPDTPFSWRSRDLRGARSRALQSSSGGGGTANSNAIILRELQLELGPANDFLQLYVGADVIAAPGICFPEGDHPSAFVFDTYSSVVAEADLLFKSLVHFVMELPGSTDALQYVAQCSREICPPLTCIQGYVGLSDDVFLAELALDGAFINLTICYMLSRLDSTGPGYMGPLYRHPVLTSLGQDPDSPTIATPILNALQCYCMGEELPRGASCAFLPPYDDSDSREYEESNIHISQYTVLSYVLVYRFKSLISLMLHPNVLDKLPDGHPVANLLYRRAEWLLAALHLVTLQWEPALLLRRRCRRDCAVVLADTFNMIMQSTRRTQFNSVFSGLHTHLLSRLSICKYPMRWASSDRLSLELEPETSDGSATELSANWLTLAIEYSHVPIPDMSEDDLSLFAQLVNQALMRVHDLEPAQIDNICDLMASTLVDAKCLDDDAHFQMLHELWATQLVDTGSLRPEEDPIVVVIFIQSPDSLVRLLHALKVDGEAGSGVLGDRLVDILVVTHGVTLESSEDDDTSAGQTTNAVLKTTQLIAQWSLDMPEYSKEWHSLFAWLGRYWLDAVHETVPTILADAARSVSEDVPKVLERMASNLRVAAKNDWETCDSEGAVSAWLHGLFHVRSPDGADKQRQIVDGPAEALFTCCRDALASLLDAIHDVVEIRDFSSPLVDEMHAIRERINSWDS